MPPNEAANASWKSSSFAAGTAIAFASSRESMQGGWLEDVGRTAARQASTGRGARFGEHEDGESGYVLDRNLVDPSLAAKRRRAVEDAATALA